MLSREQVERQIYNLMGAIRTLVMAYSPDDIYFSGMIRSDGRIYFNNTYWELPDEQRINFAEFIQEESE